VHEGEAGNGKKKGGKGNDTSAIELKRIGAALSTFTGVVVWATLHKLGRELEMSGGGGGQLFSFAPKS